MKNTVVMNVEVWFRCGAVTNSIWLHEIVIAGTISLTKTKYSHTDKTVHDMFVYLWTPVYKSHLVE